MQDSDSFWDFYWDTRLREMETLGKREAILAGSGLVRRLSRELGRPLRMIEPGCGEGQVVGALLDAHSQHIQGRVPVGVDYNPRSLARCRKDHPGWPFIEGDFTSPAVMDGLNGYDIVLLVNAIHEVFSFTRSPETKRVDVPLAKQGAAQALARSVNCLAPGGWLLLFDGLEPPNPDEEISIRFNDQRARAGFETFAAEYRPFKIHYQSAGGPLRVRLSRHDFARYITKSIFLGKALWQSEQNESYQYFTEIEFRAACANCGLRIHELRTLTVNMEKWRRLVDPGPDGFPAEHILILAQKENE